MINKCPWCGKTNCILEVAFLNCETYGNEHFTVQCVHCKQVIEVFMSRIVRVDEIQKSEKSPEDCDW